MFWGIQNLIRFKTLKKNLLPYLCKMKKKPRDKKAKSTFHKFVRPSRPKKTVPERKKEITEEMRLSKYVAHCGIAARRKAAEYIKQGLVHLNNEVVREPGVKVKPGDVVKYRGKVITPELEKVYILMNKPKDTITTAKDELGRKTVFDILGDEIKVRLFSVGRLDRATTGLLLLTNDGDLAKKLSHPSHEISKLYHITLDKPVTEAHLKQIAAGLELEDGFTPVDKVSYVKGKAKNEIGIEIHIGRNRIVRRIFEHFGYKVKHLDRTYYAGLTKKDLARGKYRFLKERELVMLKHFT